jgi:hypothetical protein
VAHLSITNEVDDNIVMEFLSELSCSLKYEVNIFHTVSIDMEDWCIDSFCQIRAVSARPSFIWGSSESDLIVYNNMDSSTYGVILKILHLHRFINNTLTRESCVTVDKNWANLLSFYMITSKMLFSSYFSHNDWVDTLKMRWISKNFASHMASVWILSSKTCS